MVILAMKNYHNFFYNYLNIWLSGFETLNETNKIQII